MSRRYGDEVEVRVRDGVPEQFLWRGRLYLVREVLGRWCRTGPWWRGPEVRGLLLGLTSRESPDVTPAVSAVGAGAPPGVPGPAGHGRQRPGDSPGGSSGNSPGEPSVGLGAGGPSPVGVDLQERSYWRVSAATGRFAPLGVYDLCFEESRGRWTLARTHD